MLKSTNCNILIFSHPRCGSSTTREIVESLTCDKILFEPFARQKFSSNNFKHHLRFLMKEAKGIKHTTLEPWPFLESDTYELNRILIDKLDKIIFLSRTNKFETALSLEISRQIKNWSNGIEFKDRCFQLNNLVRDTRLHPLEPVNLDSFGEIIDRLNRFEETYLPLIENKRHLKLEYEELLSNPEQFASKIKKFLGVEGRLASGVCNRKTNSQETYELLPNFGELLLRFGEHTQHQFH